VISPTYTRKEIEMLYVMILSWKPGLTRAQQDEALIKRSQWEYPAGVKVVGEYWLSSPSANVISIFEADDYEPIMELDMAWSGFFDINTSPATTPEAGLQMGQRIMERRST
jgi:hypothetical protein